MAARTPRNPFQSPRFGQIATFMLLPAAEDLAGLDVFEIQDQAFRRADGECLVSERRFALDREPRVLRAWPQPRRGQLGGICRSHAQERGDGGGNARRAVRMAPQRSAAQSDNCRKHFLPISDSAAIRARRPVPETVNVTFMSGRGR